MLQAHSSQTLVEQLAERVAQRIQTRLLAPGARLPSIRKCADSYKVSPATVVAAYDRLLAQGLIISRRNRGFFVREGGVPTFTGTRKAGGIEPSVSANRPPPVNAAALIRGMFHRDNGLPQPGMGAFPPDWLDASFMPTALRGVITTRVLQTVSLQYGEPAGDSELRQALSRKLATIQIPATAEQIITTVGATQALDVASRTLLRAGDSVMVEEPGWAIEFARLAALGMRILPVPRRADGPDLDVMARYCEAHAGTPQAPKLFVSVSVLHNPTGFCITPASAHRVLQLAHAHDFHILEDDTYSHLASEHATRISALDGLQRCIYISGFAKILAPNWRLGYMAAPKNLVERLLDTKMLTTLTTPALLEKALAWCIDQGQLHRHAERIRQRLDIARTHSVRLAQEHGCTFMAEPAGLFGWVDTGVDTEILAQRMLDEGYLLAPGALFHAARQAGSLMRINFPTTQDARFWRVFARLSNEIRK